MNHLSFKTTLNTPFQKVVSGFDESLYKSFGGNSDIHVQRFDGLLINDEIHSLIGLFGICELWQGIITESEKSQEHFFYVDEGKSLPSMFKSWRHEHLITPKGDQTEINEDIYFEGINFFWDKFLKEALKLHFDWRMKHYQKYFN